MDILNDNNFGKPLDDELIALIKRNTTPSERKEVCLKHDKHIQSAHSILSKAINLSYTNHMVIEEMLLIAWDKMPQRKKHLDNDIELLQKILNHETII